MILTKPCSKCGISKPLDDFHTDNRASSGKKSECKECRKDYTRRYNEENGDKRKEYYERVIKKKNNHMSMLERILSLSQYAREES